ncbi:MAG: hypothetical protein K2H20_03615, partial [Bacilli bacterium]|nr:hypothetical protein [Bacilli bacterium]
LNIDYFPWEGLQLSSNWPTSLEIMSADGNVMIANSAPEIEELSKRTYVIYLPDEPNMFQVLFLEKISEELADVSLDVGIYGNYKEEFLKRRLAPNFDAHDFLKKYIAYHKNKLEESKLTMKKVLP